MFERLEQRRLLTAVLQPDGLLQVLGTDGDDNIQLFISADQIVVRDGAGDSSFNLSDVTGIDVAAGAGDDHVQLDPDVMGAHLEGEDGNDTLIGGNSDDTLQGGPGQDHLDGKLGGDVLDGGTGFDSADYRFRAENLVISLNDAPDDGAAGGAEGDNVRSNIERVVSGSGDDLIVGSDDDNSVSAGEGNDTVVGGLGNDSLDGEGGDDWLIGEQGDDRLTGGPGSDLMEGRSGDDTFVAEDGERDTLDGGAGTDTAETVDVSLDQMVDIENAPSVPAGEITVLRGLNELVDGESVVDFGAVARGDPAPTRTFTVRNDGKDALKLGNVQAPDGFTLVEGLAGSLDSGQSDTFTIRLESDTLGDKGGFVRISSSDANENPFTFRILGTVQDGPPPSTPEITVLRNGNVIVDDQGSVGFGTVLRGVLGPERTFVVRNDGLSTLKLGNLQAPAGFIIVDDLAGSIAAGDSDQFTLRMITAAVGSLGGQVRFSTNDSDENPFLINVSGTVTRAGAPKITLMRGASRIGNGATINFGNVVQGRNGKVISLKVRNDGNAKLSLGSVRAPAGFTLTKAPPKTLAPRKTATISIRLDASGSGNKSGTVTLGKGGASISFTVRGSVTTPTPPPSPADIAVFNGSTRINDGSSSAVNFGTVTSGGATRSITFRVTNEGRSALRITNVTVPGGYTVTDGLGATINPGASDNLTIRLDSGSAGTKSGSVNISSNDGDENPFNFAITGRVDSGGGGGGQVNATLDSFGTLIIKGTAGSDSIVVKGSGSSATVTMNGASKTFNGVKKIGVDAGEGNDMINLSAISLPSSVDGKGGNDTILGGGGSDTLHGGLGNDSIVGGFGADSLFGDDGDDTLDAADGTADPKVDGGNGNDTIKADPTDSKTGT
jgi:hypothetical protein